jgi:hypothetical protein
LTRTLTKRHRLLYILKLILALYSFKLLSAARDGVEQNIHCKKKLAILSSPAFPARESLVSVIPAGDVNIANLFLQCTYVLTGEVISIFMGEEGERWNTKP